MSEISENINLTQQRVQELDTHRLNKLAPAFPLNQTELNSSQLNSFLDSAIRGTNTSSDIKSNGTAGLNLSLFFRGPTAASGAAVQLLDHVKVAMRESGFSENGTTEICGALSVLAKYGILATGHGDEMPSTPQTNGNGFFGLSDPCTSQLEKTCNIFGSQAAFTPVSINSNSFVEASKVSAAQTNHNSDVKNKKTVEIPEVIVGAILGRNGRHLVEIHQHSGADVQISQKGVFAPGTKNRIVTISGHPVAIARAQNLINRKITEEKSKRSNKSLK